MARPQSLTVPFAAQVPASTGALPNGWSLSTTKLVTRNCIIRRVVWRIWSGSAGLLLLRPVIVRQNQYIDLLDYASSGAQPAITYLEGDNDLATFDMHIEARKEEDTLGILAINQSTANAYNYRVLMSLDFLSAAGGHA